MWKYEFNKFFFGKKILGNLRIKCQGFFTYEKYSNIIRSVDFEGCSSQSSFQKVKEELHTGGS